MEEVFDRGIAFVFEGTTEKVFYLSILAATSIAASHGVFFYVMTPMTTWPP